MSLFLFVLPSLLLGLNQNSVLSPPSALLCGSSPFCSFSSSSSSSSSSLCSSPCMRQRGKVSKTGSMCVKLLRCGFGVKYFGFWHIRSWFFLFLFHRVAPTTG